MKTYDINGHPIDITTVSRQKLDSNVVKVHIDGDYLGIYSDWTCATWAIEDALKKRGVKTSSVLPDLPIWPDVWGPYFQTDY